MSKLLYIEASPRKKRSSSIAIAQVFLNEYKKAHPENEVDYLDLWKEQLPVFDGDVIDAKYAIMHSQPHTEAQAKAWKAVEAAIAQFKAADLYLFSLPMWNFGIPYKLKHYFDVLIQPGYTFTVTPEGYKGLVTNKRTVIIYSRGGAYGAETGAQQLDFQKPYMETILRFIGIEKFDSIIIEPTLQSPEQKEAAFTRAKSQAEQLAASFDLVKG